MNFTIATTNQLEVIMKHDSNCPLSLLRGAVSELLNREYFDRMINEIIHFVIKDTKRVDEVFKIEVADWMQIGRLHVYKAIDRFKGDKGTNFFSFVYRIVKHELIKEVVFMQAKKRNTTKTVSYQNETDRGTEFEKFLIDRSRNVERYVVNKLTIEGMLNKVNKHQCRVLLLWLRGYNFCEISEMIGHGTGKTISKSYKSAIEKMRKGA